MFFGIYICIKPLSKKILNASYQNPYLYRHSNDGCSRDGGSDVVEVIVVAIVVGALGSTACPLEWTVADGEKWSRHLD